MHAIMISCRGLQSLDLHGPLTLEVCLPVNSLQVLRKDFDILLTTYDFLMSKNDRPRLSKFNWQFIIIDEGHRLKNANCKLNRELKMYKSKSRLLLTGGQNFWFRTLGDWYFRSEAAVQSSDACSALRLPRIFQAKPKASTNCLNSK
jgi:hypothetical protein